MKRVYDFLQQLAANNNKEWFTEHKAEYLEAKAVFDGFTQRLIDEVGKFDPYIKDLTVKDCTYRIYRDVRFSSDKSPYKTHMGCYLNRGGKKSGYSGYYFHIGTEQGGSYPKGHMLAVGDYCMDPKALKVLREDISMGEGDFERIITRQVDPRFELDKSFKLKRAPMGYAEDAPYIDLLKYKVFCLCAAPTTEEVLASDAVERVAGMFRTAKPFVDYINRAIEYVREGNE